MLAVRSKTGPRHAPVQAAAVGCAACPREGEVAVHDQWIATLSHELRGPLATITYALEAISGAPDLDPGARRARDVADRQVRKALQLVDDLLDVCAGDRGKLALRKEVVDLAAIVAGATETVAPLVAKSEHRLTVALPPEPVTMFADPLRLEQVLTNLLTNAAKFTPPGGHIRLSAEANSDAVVLRVRDNGRGMAPDLLPRVFELFQQGSGDERAGGLGIGLALVKSLVALHGGSVTASSAGRGTGAEFVVRLPLCAEEAEPRT